MLYVFVRICIFFYGIAKSLILKCAIKFFFTYVSVYIESIKTNIYRRGNTVTISKTNGATCPVTWLRKYLRVSKYFCRVR